jgi:nucleoside-diphosphate-sugar epimerase
VTAPAARTALVTGASGFIGGHVCTGLRDAGYAVRGVVRRPAATAELDARGVTAVVADSGDRAALAAALDGVRHVVHAAGVAHRSDARGEPPFVGGNVETTRALLDASLGAGVATFVLVSSVAAVAGPGAGRPAPDAPPAPSGAYGRSKLEAERIVLAGAARGAIRAPILRPPAVYGPGMKGNPLRLLRAVDRGLALPLGRVRNRRSLLYIDDLVSAVIAAIESPQCGAGPWFLAGEAVSTADFVRLAGAALGRRPRIVAVPVSLLRAAGRLADIGGGRLPLGSQLVEGLTGDLVLDATPFTRATGWRPRVGIAEGLRRTAAWYGELARR